MVKEFYPSIQPQKMKIAPFLLIGILALVVGIAKIGYAQGYYYAPSYYSNYSAANTGTAFSNAYNTNAYNTYSVAANIVSPYTYGNSSYAGGTYAPASSYFLVNSPSYSTAGTSYYNGNNSSYSATTSRYSTQASFYSPSYTPQSSSYSSGSNGFYYSNATPSYTTPSYNTSSYTTPSYTTLNTFYAAPSTPSTNSTSYYQPASTAGSSYYNYSNSANSYATNSSYYNGSAYYTNSSPYYTATASRTAAAVTPYYPATNTIYASTQGYTTNAVVNVTGIYEGNWVRNYSANGAPTSGRTSNFSSMRSTNDEFSSSDHGGGCSSENKAAPEPITLELNQVDASINGTVTFFADSSTPVKTISVNGTIEDDVVNLTGTTTGSTADPIVYGIKITATVEDNTLKGAYTLTNTATNADIELGTFSADK